MKTTAPSARSRLLQPVRGTLVGAGILQGLASLCSIIPFLVVVEIARELLTEAPDGDRVWLLVGVTLGLLGARLTLASIAMLWTHVVDAAYTTELRRTVATRLSRVPLGWFTERNSGEIKKSLQDDIGALHYLVAHSVLDLIAAITVPIVSLAYLFFVDWRLALVVMLPLVGYVFALSIMMRGNTESMATYTEWGTRINTTAIEFIDGARVVRTFGQAGKAHARYEDAVTQLSHFFAAWVKPLTRIEAWSSTLLHPAFVMGFTLVAGLAFVQWGWIMPLTILPFLLLGLTLGAPVQALGHGAQGLREATNAADRIVTILDEPALETLSPAVTTMPVVAGGRRVEFEKVSFSYRDDHLVLDDVSATLEPGTITALVGASGSGKSSLARLVPRFADPTAGRVLLDGVDLRSIDAAELYRQVGFVFQEVRLLRVSVRDNIALARPGASDDEVERVAKAARIHDRILELPRGYDSVVGEDAVLSGGEAQRLSIARALLADAPVLVLDEATAFADPESESAIQDALATLVAGRTVLVIAHRLHTIVGVDRILVLDAGRLVETGTHRELLEANGQYATLWRLGELAHATTEGTR